MIHNEPTIPNKMQRTIRMGEEMGKWEGMEGGMGREWKGKWEGMEGGGGQ